jgi:hypothetical protein
MDDNINWFILLVVNFKCNRSPKVETTSGGVVERVEGEGSTDCGLFQSSVTIQREREKTQMRDAAVVS